MLHSTLWTALFVAMSTSFLSWMKGRHLQVKNIYDKANTIH